MLRLGSLFLCSLAIGSIIVRRNSGSGTVTNVTASAPLSSTGGTTPNISLSTPLALNYGGWGQDMTMQTLSTSGTTNAAPCGLIKVTSATTPTINGIVQDGTSKFCYWYNATSNNVNFNHENSSATASNRFSLTGSTSYSLPPSMGVWFFYDTVSSRWRGPDEKITATSPLSLSSGAMSIQVANASQNGYLSSSDWNTFNSKLSGSGVASRTAFWSTTSTLSSNEDYSWNDTKRFLGIGADYTESNAGIHVNQTYGDTVSDITGSSLTPTQVVLPSPYTGYSVGPTTPYMQIPAQSTSPAGYINGGSGGIQAVGNSYDYKVEPMYNGWAGKATLYISIGSDPNDATFYDIDIGSWTQQTSVYTVDNWRVWRNTNGNGYNEYIDLGTTSSFIDNGTGWNSGSFPSSPQFNDFVANGSSHSYSSYSRKTTYPVTIYSSNYDASFNDANDGTTFLISHSFSGATGDDSKFIKLSNSYVHGAINDSFVEDTSTFSSSDLTITPTNYGVLSSGANSFNVNIYNYDVINGTTIYSTTPDNVSWSDPSDATYYYFTINFSGYADGAKLLHSDGSAKVDTDGSQVWDGGTTVWGDTTTVTPTTYIYPAAIFQAATQATSGPQVILKAGSGETWTDINFVDGSDTLYGQVNANSTRFSFNQGNSSVRRYELTSSEHKRYNASVTETLSSLGYTLTGGTFTAPQGLFTTLSTASVPLKARVLPAQTANAFEMVDGANTALTVIDGAGRVGIRNIVPTAFLDLAQGAPTATFAPMKWHSGNLLATPEIGAMEFLTDKWYGTINTGTARKEFTLNDTALNSGIVPYTTTNGRLTNSTVTSTELGYLSGVTSSIQTQLGTKVTSVTASSPLSSSGGTTPNITLGTVTTANGGTGLTSWTQGDIPYFTSGTALSKLAKSTSSTRYLSNQGASNAPSWSQINLTNGVTGTLPIASGGTGTSDSTLLDGSSVNSIDWANRRGLDTSGNLSLDWGNHILQTSSGNGYFNWETGIWVLDDGTITMDASSRYLYNPSGNIVADWSSGFLTKRAFNQEMVTLTDAATISIDAALGNNFKVTLGGNRTLGNPTNGVDGQKITIRVRQDGTGSRTLAYDTKYRFGNSLSSITLTTTANKTDYLGFVYHAADDKWDAVSFADGY